MLPFLKAQKEDAALQEQRTRIDARPVRPEAYYEQALALFGMGWDDGVYQFSPAGDLQVRWQR